MDDHLDAKTDSQLTIAQVDAVPVLPEDVAARARRLIEDGTPPNTRLAYQSDLDYIQAWARARGLPDTLPMTANMVMMFIVDHADGMDEDVEARLVESGAKRDFGALAISTIKRRVASLSVAHTMAKLPNPCKDPQVTDLLARSRRAMARRGWTPSKKLAAALEVLEMLLETCNGNSVWDIRDRAILFFGFSTGGRRRSEIVEATFDRLEAQGSDFIYRLGITKTSQDGDGDVVPLAGRAALAMEAWMARVRPARGPIFRPIWPNGEILDRPLCDKSVALIIKKRARLAKLDPARFGGHSLRSGFMTEAGLQGLTLQEAMQLSGHKSMQVAGSYYQAGSGLRNKAARLAG